MKNLLLSASAALSVVVLLGCGGKPPAKTGGEATGAGGAGAQTLAEGAAPDLSPVAAPADLVVVGRLKNPAGMVDTVASWARLPMDWRGLINKQEPGIDQVVHFEAPVEVAVSLDPTGSGDFPQPFAVVSLGLRSLDGALDFIRREGEPVRQVRAGVYRVGSGHAPSCAVAASVGAAPARLVCGDRPEDVDALLPYATRGLPNENLGASDLHLEVRAEPLRRRYARELRQLKTLATPFVLREISLDDPRFDRALADTVHALADEVLALAEDVDTVTLDASVHGQKGVIDGSMAMKFRASSSWTAQSLLEVQKRTAPPGELFWNLPLDSAAGTYSVGVDAKRYQAMRRTLAELLDGFLAHENVPRRVRDQLTELVEQAWVTDAGSVYARGDLPPGNSSLTGPARMRERMREGFGWHVLGIADSSKKFTSALDKAVKVYNDPQLRKMLKKRGHIDAKELPTLKTRRARGLPAGSKVYELTLPGEMFKEWVFDAKGKDKSKIGKPLSFVVIVVPDGEKTWIGASADEKLLTEKLAVAKAGDSKKTLASKEGLAPLRSKKAASGGFFTLMGFLASMRSTLLDSGTMSSKDVERALSAMPHHGETPMLQTITVEPGAGPTLRWHMTLPKAVVEDIAALGPAMAAGAMHMGGSPPMMQQMPAPAP